MVWRIAFPYSRPGEDYRGAWVELAPSSHPGFREVICEGERFRIPREDVGPRILDRLEGKGCVGLLHQWGEGREILDRRGGTVCGQGSSMQLALVLSAVCGNETPPAGPLVMISAAVDHPFGSPPFLGARAVPYAEASRVESDLLDKYETALQAKASALVLPKRDAQLLSKILEENKGEAMPVLGVGELSEQSSRTVLVGLNPEEVSVLAGKLGAPSSRFAVAQEPKGVNKAVLISGLLIAILVSLFLWWKAAEEQRLEHQQLKRRRELIANIFSAPGEIHRRLRDESLIEFLEIERQRREDEVGSRGESIERVDLKEVYLEGADLHRVDLSDINFLKADLREVNLNRSVLMRSYFKGANLSGAHLYRADLRFAVLPLANLSNANLRQANMRECVGLESANLKGAQYDDNTRWPESMSRDLLLKKGAVYKASSDQPVFVWPGNKSREW